MLFLSVHKTASTKNQNAVENSQSNAECTNPVEAYIYEWRNVQKQWTKKESTNK